MGIALPLQYFVFEVFSREQYCVSSGILCIFKIFLHSFARCNVIPRVR